MISTEMILVAFGGVLFIIMIYSYMRDNENSRQIRFLANTMDNFNKQIFTLERKFEKIEVYLKDKESRPTTSTSELEKKMEQELASMAEPIAFSLNEIQSAFIRFKQQMESRLENVEDGMKSFTMPKSLLGLDDQKIISLYKQGMDEESIARELAVSKGEVEFALKIFKMQ